MDGPIPRPMPSPECGSAGEGLGLKAVQLFVLRRWLVVTLTLAIVLFATAAVLRTVTPRYTAHAEVLLDPHGEKPYGPDNVLHLINLDNADIESAIALIKGGSLLARVVASEHLTDDLEFVSTMHGRPTSWRRAFGGADALPLSPDGQAAAALWRALKVERIGKSFALSLSVTSRDPATANRLTNAVANAYVGDRREARLDASRRAAAYFANRLAPLGAQLKQSEDALERFRRDHGLITPGGAAPGGKDGTATLPEQRVAELNSRLVAAQGETAAAWARFSQARTVEAQGGAVEAIPDVLRSPLIVQLRQQQAEVARKEADLSARYTDGYPLLTNARAERREIERGIAREVARILANLKGAYDVAKSQEDTLRASLAVTTGAAGLDNDLGPKLRELERQKAIDQTLFEAYLAKARETEQQTAFEDRDARVISPAERPTVPSFPQRGLVIACMVVFGLGLGIALGLALDALAPGFLTSRQTEDELGLPVIAAVPWLGTRNRITDGRRIDPTRYLVDQPQSAYAEAVHYIRAGVRMSAGAPAKLVLVTSAVRGEGKTAIAVSLALTAARAGQRVLMVDADLRAPSLSRTFACESRLGLTDLVSGFVGTAETTVALGGGLAIMPAGRCSAVAPDVFASERMSRYLAHVRGIYDFVVVDAAPAGVVVDARLLAELSDRIIFVVGWRATARELVVRNLRMIGQTHKLAGIVLNKVDTQGRVAWSPWRRSFASASDGVEAS